MKSRWVFGTLLSLVAVAMLVGCGGGGSDRPDLGKVKCTVTVNGQALTYGHITFEPDRTSGTRGRPSTGTIKNGKVDYLTCFDEGDGAVAGTHKVRIRCPEGGAPAAGGAAAAPAEGMEGMEGAPTDAMMGMEEAPKDLIPKKYNTATTLKATVKAGETNTFKFDLEISNFEMP